MFVECARPIALALGLFVLLGATGATWAQSTPDYAALLAAPDRSDADQQADKRRDPLPLLALAGVRPGMKVLDMAPAAATAQNCLRAPLRRAASFTPRTLPIFSRNPRPLSKRA